MPGLDSERLRHLSLNDTVPIMEHHNCSGNEGTINQISPKNIIVVRCNKCLSTGVFIDRTPLQPLKP